MLSHQPPSDTYFKQSTQNKVGTSSLINKYSWFCIFAYKKKNKNKEKNNKKTKYNPPSSQKKQQHVN